MKGKDILSESNNVKNYAMRRKVLEAELAETIQFADSVAAMSDVERLGLIIYENNRYLDEWSSFGEKEMARAEKVIAIAKGDVEIAENMILEFRIR